MSVCALLLLPTWQAGLATAQPAAAASYAALSVGFPAERAAPDVAGCAVFPDDSIWNTPVDNLPVDANSATYVNTIGALSYVHADFGSGLWEGGPIGIPYTTVPGTQPRVNVSFDYADESDPGPYPIPTDAPIEGGAGSNGDRHVLVVDRDNCVLYELFDAWPQSDGSWQAGSGAVFDLHSNALRPAGWTSADAAGLPMLPGLARYDEAASGEIRHALRFTAPQTRRLYTWPARHYASNLTGAQYPPMGQRFRLKASFDTTGFSPEVQVILRALIKYGMILADNGAPWFISGAPDERWDNDALHDLHDVHGSDFEAVDVSSLLLDSNSAAVRSTARTYYVGPSGSNANPGTRDAPWVTPGYGSRRLAPGDTLIILPGRYVLQAYDADILTPPSGTAGAWVTIKGEAGGRPVLAGRDDLFAAVSLAGASYVRLENLEITHDDRASGAAAYFRNGIVGSGAPASHIVLKDLYIHHVDEGGLDFQDVDDLLVQDCRIEYCGGDAIGGPVAAQGGWRNVRIEGCRLSYSGHYYQGGDGSSRPYDRPDGFGIEPSSGPIAIVGTAAEYNFGDGLDSKAANTTIERCLVADNTCDGVKLWAGNSSVVNTLSYGSGWSGLVLKAGSSYTVTNSTVANTRRYGYTVYVGDDDGPTLLRLHNNVFYNDVSENGGTLIFFPPGLSYSGDNNLFFDPYRPDEVICWDRGGSQDCFGRTEFGNGAWSVAVSGQDSHSRYADPLFVNTAAGDFHLGAGSPAVDAAGAAWAPPVDLDGASRPQGAGPDIGAYERAASGAPTPTATATRTATSTPTATRTPSGTPTPTATSTSSGGEATLALQQGLAGYAGSDDTYIYAYAATSSYCASDLLKADYRQQNAALLRFALSDLPPGATIMRAELQLHAAGWGGTNATIGAYAVLRAVSHCQATWNQAASGSPWGAPGGESTASDRRAAPAASLTTAGINRRYSLDLTALVQEWASGALTNNGVLLRASSTSTAVIYFASAQRGDASQRPRLVITYRSAGGTATPTLVSTATTTSTATRTLTPKPTLTQAAGSTPTPTTDCAETALTLRQGGSGHEDTYIYQYAPAGSLCAQGLWKVGYKQQYAALLRFELAAIPANAVILKATLQVCAVGWDGTSTTLGAHAILRPMQACQATWNQAQTGSAWGLPGGNDVSSDRRATAESSVTARGINQWYSFDLTALAAQWVRGALANNGILLRAATTSTSLFSFASGQNGTASARPVLVIRYRCDGAAPAGHATETASMAPTPSSTTDAREIIRVMTYNIQDGGGTGPTDPDGPWCCGGRGCCGASGGDRLPQILQVLKAANPDILGIQEAYLWQLDNSAIARRVAAELGMNFYVGQSQSANGAHVALFTRFAITRAQAYPGHFEGNKADYTPRAALHAELATPDGQTIHVFVVHLKFQVAEMLYLVQQMAPYLNSSTLLLGDMNFRDPSEMADRLRGAGWRHPLADPRRIDQIWTSPSLEPFAQPGPAIPPELTTGASDHRPVVVDLRLP